MSPTLCSCVRHDIDSGGLLSPQIHRKSVLRAVPELRMHMPDKRAVEGAFPSPRAHLVSAHTCIFGSREPSHDIACAAAAAAAAAVAVAVAVDDNDDDIDDFGGGGALCTANRGVQWDDWSAGMSSYPAVTSTGPPATCG
eukprot:COSAG05_NODE_1165_length_5641_cov_433.265608_4_plen_140_part_00